MNLKAVSALGHPVGSKTRLAQPSGERIALIERADIASVMCATAAEPETFPQAVASVLQRPVPKTADRVAWHESMCAIWLSPRSCIVQCRVGEEDLLVKTVSRRFQDKTIHAVRYTDQLGWLELVGDDAEPLLKQSGFLNLEAPTLPANKSKRTLFAGIPVILVRTEPSWLLGVSRNRMRYLSIWLAATHAKKPQQWRTI